MQTNKITARSVFLSDIHPGNHDAPLQKYSGMHFGNIAIQRETIHETATGAKYLVLHGDQFDSDVTLGRFHEWMGDKGYELLLTLNRWYNAYMQKRNKRYWSLASYIKRRIRGANLAIDRYRNAACKRAEERGLNGVICGHIHYPEYVSLRNIHYVNDGDWVDSCSALIENKNGELQLMTASMLQAKLFEPTDLVNSIRQAA